MINIPGAGKAYAEYVAAPATQLAIKPDHLQHFEAAAAGIAAMTAWQALTEKAHLKAGQKILIHAAAGGVGHYAVQMAKHLGAFVIGTSSAENKDFVLKLGADEHIDYKQQNFEDVSPEVDVVLDSIGGDNIDRSLKVLKKGGTIISLPSGISESVTEKAAAQGKTGIFFLVSSNGKLQNEIAQLLEKKIIRSHVSEIFEFGDIKLAHEKLESGKTRGKLILKSPANQ
jgi:NADPH:quinone reductase-like Zn-dependent oxidoreductase